jgi:DNA modification methylase
MTKTNLILGDCLDKLKELEDNSVDSIVTDPPYGLSFMGQKWDYDVPSVDVWKECFRVLKPGGHLLSFAGSRTYHRMAVNIEDAGFEIRDQIMWVYGSGFPKSHNVGKKVPDFDGWGTALKPAHEPIVLARKPFKGTVANNVLEYGTGAINIDATRIPTEDDLNGGAYSICNKKKEDASSYFMGMNAGVYKQPEGRWPANFIHDGSDEVIELFPETNPSKSGIRKNKSGMGIHDSEKGTFGKGDVFGGYDDQGSAARFFYCPKANKKDRNEGCDDLEEKQYSSDGRDTPIENAYQRNNSVSSNNHPTVKPTELMRYLVRLVTPKNGTVLDPFMGSGSTGKAAVLEGFSFTGIELSQEYLNIAEKRINHAITDNE